MYDVMVILLCRLRHGGDNEKVVLDAVQAQALVRIASSTCSSAIHCRIGAVYPSATFFIY
jgi:hypothetical protein